MAWSAPLWPSSVIAVVGTLSLRVHGAADHRNLLESAINVPSVPTTYLQRRSGRATWLFAWNDRRTPFSYCTRAFWWSVTSMSKWKASLALAQPASRRA